MKQTAKTIPCISFILKMNVEDIWFRSEMLEICLPWRFHLDTLTIR